MPLVAFFSFSDLYKKLCEERRAAGQQNTRPPTENRFSYRFSLLKKIRIRKAERRCSCYTNDLMMMKKMTYVQQKKQLFLLSFLLLFVCWSQLSWSKSSVPIG